MDVNRNELYLKDSVLGLLDRLNFSNICSVQDAGYPDPDYSVPFDGGYVPPVTAAKHEVIYFFEIVTIDMLESDGLRKKLRTVAAELNGCRDKDFILVTEYGNKEKIREWCMSQDIPAENIWEF